ncbi:thiosulfate sulfurtransferase 16, chloroplastic isoform X2 [Phoenix dactylifera]|uniref:Thiosulfate sulfurtransferase 16, chloroplastic isoform X2 n=1 Tax=Phoenix dactylifera TaxID=42345 RepID=A0A8B7D2L7_PHODC|nr:thiosulfate sulfurtransferase 16, chloroplastic isoform X2 [Phoenix dactylifera]
MASYSRVSLPVLLSPPPPKRFLSLSPTFLSASKHSGHQHAVSGAQNGRPGFLRSVSSDGNPEIGVPRSVPVRVAHELLQAGYRYLDVRTVDEFNAGHAVGAKNIPYMLKVGSGKTKNPNFLKEVLEVFGKDDEIIIGCQSGRLSLMATAELSSAGFTGITDIAGGYSAWIQNGLPIEQ